MESILDKINSLEDLKKIPFEDLKKLSEEIRERIIAVVSKNGGHLASNLGVIELTIALHYVFNSPVDKIIWDVGHQCYAHKLLTGRKKEFSTLRTFEGLSGFPKKEESPHDSFNTGHASTSISAALGMACARDQKGENYQVIAVVGDGALTGGLAFEGLNNVGAQGRNLVVILNDNSMSISKNVGAISKYLTDLITDEKYNKLKAEVWDLVGKFKRRDRIRTWVASVEESVKGFLVPGIIFEKLGFRYLGPIDGHDMGELVKVLTQIKSLKGPIFLHLLTTKGKGYKYAEEDAPKFHGIGAFDKVTGNSNTTAARKTYTDVFGESMVEMAEKNPKIVGLTAAMCLGTGLYDFSLKFPKRFYDVGIAEEHGTTFAAGLASLGLKPVFAVYSTFLQRAFDQLIHDISLQNLSVIFAIDRAGLVGEDGPTHHGAFDLSYLRQIPNLTVAAPKNGSELKNLFFSAIEWPDGPVAIRYPRAVIPDELNSKIERIDQAKWELMQRGKDVLVLAVGSMVYPALEAVGELLKEDIYVTVVNCRFIKPLDYLILNELLSTTDKILTVEENALSGGFGSAILEFLEESGYNNIKVKRLGIPDKFIQHGPRSLLLDELNLNSAGIRNGVKALLTMKNNKVNQWKNK
jgi:1-deoxy-D-xylulose-5-phosphate synthase